MWRDPQRSGSCWHTSHCQPLNGTSHSNPAPPPQQMGSQAEVCFKPPAVVAGGNSLWPENRVCSLLQSRQCTDDNPSRGYCEATSRWSQREEEERCTTVLRSAVRTLSLQELWSLNDGVWKRKQSRSVRAQPVIYVLACGTVDTKESADGTSCSNGTQQHLFFPNLLLHRVVRARRAISE